jgi:Ca-activated chloride channel family protein
LYFLTFNLKRFFNIGLLLLFPLLAFCQQYYVKGQVRDEEGRPLQNVLISVKSTGYVYFSGSDGSFGIPTYARKDSFTFSYDGFVRHKIEVDATEEIHVKLVKAVGVRKAYAYRLASVTKNLKRELQQDWFIGDETYASLVENGFIKAEHYPNTGLTLNIDKASYSNIRRFLSMNTQVPPDAVRLEEMLNYFNLNYEEPPPGKTFTIQTTLTQCPWSKNSLLLFAKLDSRKLNYDSLPPSHLVFLIDISGSMDMPNRLPLLKSGFKALVNNLRDKDSVSIVVYGGTVGIALETTGGGEKEKILRTIDSLQPGGSTPGESGIKLAYSVARNHFIKDGNNRIILATDGDFNVGLKKEEELEEMIVQEKERGIYLTCLGIGMGNYKDSKIQTLAQRGNGNFAYLDSYAEAEKVLLKEFAQTLYTVADDAYLNVQFDPELVKEYRLLGFDNKMGAIKDTTAIIEGGEIGSAYSLLIAFEIIPAKPIQPGTENTVLKPASFGLQFREAGNHEYRVVNETPAIPLQAFLHTAKFYQFAAAVLMFGQTLRKSRYFKEANWNQILQIASGAADINSFSQKEFLLMVQQAKLLYGKKRKKEKDDNP